MKVRQSQIPEENGKPVKVSNRNSHYSGNNETENSATLISETSENEEEDETVVRTMLHIPELGFSISLFGIETIDKTFRVYESVNGTGDVKPQYGIVINRDMEKSIRYPRTNIEFWFDSEEIRDKRYNKLFKRLQDAGYKFIDA